MTTMSTEAIAEKRLMAAVVAHAVKDACLSPVIKDKKAVRPRADALSALNFLFDTSRSGVDAYALWLDFDVDQFRQKLINACQRDTASSDLHLTDDQRRNFRVNYKLYCAMPRHVAHALSEAGAEEEENA